MISVLRNLTYRRLLMAQVIALAGTGLATVALGLLAWDLAGDNAGAVLGTALAIKMIAYVTLAPIASALAERLPRRSVLVALDVVRAGVTAALPFVSEVWHVYVLIFLLQAASAGFTPVFQATIPDVLPDEGDYTRALSLSRLAYDLENLLSPMLAAALLTVVSFPVLFVGTVVGYAISALLVLSVVLPSAEPVPRRPIWDRTTRGIRMYLSTPRLRGLLALNLTVSSAGAMVIVNTVVIVKGGFGFSETQVAVALACFGGGSMVAALILPRVLDHLPDRPPMILGGVLLSLGMIVGPFVSGWYGLLALWLVLGFGFSLTQTPSGRLLRRSAAPADRPAIFAAQFALSHAMWLLAYPVAGRVGASFGMDWAYAVLGVMSVLGVFAAVRLWPANDGDAVPHAHPDLPPDHPHLREFGHHGHRHPSQVDDLHPRGLWQV